MDYVIRKLDYNTPPQCIALLDVSNLFHGLLKERKSEIASFE